MELSLHTASTSASVHGTCFCLSSLPHTLLVSLSNSPVPPLVGRSWLEVNLTRPQVPCLIPTGTPFPSNTWALDSHCYSICMCGQTGPDRYVSRSLVKIFLFLVPSSIKAESWERELVGSASTSEGRSHRTDVHTQMKTTVLRNKTSGKFNKNNNNYHKMSLYSVHTTIQLLDR